MKRKLTNLAVVTLAATMMWSCYGSFGLTNKVHEWNGQVSNEKWVNELVFIGINIVPIYSVAAFIDAVILNSIEFWTGNNPIVMKEGVYEESNLKYKGRDFRVRKTKNNVEIVNATTQESESFEYFPEEGKWYQMNGGEKVVAIN